MSAPNKQAYYITKAWNGLLGTNTLAYWVTFVCYEKIDAENMVQGPVS